MSAAKDGSAKRGLLERLDSGAVICVETISSNSNVAATCRPARSFRRSYSSIPRR